MNSSNQGEAREDNCKTDNYGLVGEHGDNTIELFMALGMNWETKHLAFWNWNAAVIVGMLSHKVYDDAVNSKMSTANWG